MASDSFVHLHLHTVYSLLDGSIRTEPLMERTAELGMPGVAMTDHGVLYGAVNFYQKAKQQEVNPILGCEVYLAPGSMHERKKMAGRPNAHHLTLLAENEVGYANLMKLVTRAHLEGQYYKPRVDKELLATFSEGILCLTGCLNGEVNYFLAQDQVDLARESLRSFVKIYGRDHLYVELQNHGLEAQTKCNEWLLQFCEDEKLKPVATNDVHYLRAEDHEAHDVMICIGTGSQIYDENRMRYPDSMYFKTAEEMRSLFAHCPQACDATLEIAERCRVEMKLDATSIARYPKFKAPDGGSPEAYFRRICQEGLVWRYGEERARERELQERLELEISTMEAKGFVSYFLIVRDFIQWARDHQVPVGPGRGSAAGSLVAYALAITDLCPIRFGLIFERFLNPERVSPPDIDIDFCQTRRPEVIEYVRNKYGERAVSHIITYGTLGAKSVVRDVGRVLGWSYGEADQLAKMVPTELGITLKKAVEKNQELRERLGSDARAEELWRYASFLEGLTRGVGIHAAGVVIADFDLDEVCPLTRGNEDEVVSQFDMGAITDLGLLKMDFLGLKTLTVIQDALCLVARREPEFDLDAVGLDDLATFELMQRGETSAVFQLESGGMANTCKQLGPDRIEDIIALLALYRPGPMDLIPDYIARKKGHQKVEYLHPLLEEVSQETYGILIYQEQVQKAANLLAGYSLGEADLLRRAMGKKKISEMVKQRAKFVQGCQEVNEIPKRKANEIFDLLEKFAGYGFNKSHSAAYGLISYQTGYLKANYPVEFMAAVLSNEINNTDKISSFVSECKRMGIEIRPPHINRSGVDFQPDGDPGRGELAIRYGLAAIKNVGGAAMETALAERQAQGDYKSLEDFANRLDSKVVNRKILESLIRAGAFDWTGERRESMFARLEGVLASSASAQRDRVSGQESLFDAFELSAAAPAPRSEGRLAVPAWPKEKKLADEKELLGFYITGHPLDSFSGAIRKGEYFHFGELDELEEGRKRYAFVCSISEMQTRYSRDNKPFAILTCEDFHGRVEVMVWDEKFTKHQDLLAAGKVVAMKATVRFDDRTESKRLSAVEFREVQPESLGQLIEIAVPLEAVSQAALSELKSLLKRHPGDQPVDLLFESLRGDLRIEIGKKLWVQGGADFERAVENWTQGLLSQATALAS
ncbi:MAG: DNA polymerase III subunit alpha [Verrucomicrobiota bacterium]